MNLVHDLNFTQKIFLFILIANSFLRIPIFNKLELADYNPVRWGFEISEFFLNLATPVFGGE